MANFNGGFIGIINTTSKGIPGRRTSFTSSNPSFTLLSSTTEFEALIVAGGGGYGAYAGASGGGGGVLYYGTETGATDPGGLGSTKSANAGLITAPPSSRTLAVTIGAAGANAPSPPATPQHGRGFQGGSSSLTYNATPYTATGGGGGAGRRQPGNHAESAQPGGSGGGATQPPGGNLGGTGISGQGNPGGDLYSPDAGITAYTGGGGGATEPGYPSAGGARGNNFGAMGGAGAGYTIADGSTLVYYAGAGTSEGFPSNPSSNPVKNSFGRSSPTTPANSGNPQKSGIVIVNEPETPFRGNGMFNLQSVYLKVKNETWGAA